MHPQRKACAFPLTAFQSQLQAKAGPVGRCLLSRPRFAMEAGAVNLSTWIPVHGDPGQQKTHESVVRTIGEVFLGSFDETLRRQKIN